MPIYQVVLIEIGGGGISLQNAPCYEGILDTPSLLTPFHSHQQFAPENGPLDAPEGNERFQVLLLLVSGTLHPGRLKWNLQPSLI